MSVINSENREAWQAIADEASKTRPSVGKRVAVVKGRKYKGRSGVVTRHQKSKFGSAFRYGGDANLQLREMRGRAGFVCLVRDDDGSEFWINADHVEVVS